jgi:hypothetical protein
MIKSILWVAVGAAAALEADKWMEKRKEKYRPSALTGTLLNKLNTTLEEKRDASPYKPTV